MKIKTFLKANAMSALVFTTLSTGAIAQEADSPGLDTTVAGETTDRDFNWGWLGLLGLTGLVGLRGLRHTEAGSRGTYPSGSATART